MTMHWNEEAFVRCSACSGTVPAGHEPQCGCDAWIEVGYPARIGPLLGLPEAVGWLSRHRNLFSAGTGVDLGQGNTPLTALTGLNPNVLLKDESANPTWSHKDRANGTNAAVAQLVGAHGLVCQTTGNHGASVAAFAAAANLRAIILCQPGTPVETQTMIWSFGGVPVAATSDEIARLLPDLVAVGYHPATAMDTPGRGCRNPYGAEAYKYICWELVSQLESMPEVVIVPAASGDTFYGVAKGFAELHDVTGIEAPLVVAVQPAQANPLQRSVDAGAVKIVEDASSLALSIANSRTGANALAATKRWRTAVVSVTEPEIIAATADLHRTGHFLEPASAAALAGYRSAAAQNLFDQGQICVLLGTASATKWLTRQGDGVKRAPLASRRQLIYELNQRNWPQIPVGGMAEV